MPVERDRDHGERILRARFAELGRPRGQKVSCRGEERVVISLAAARQLEQEAVLGLRELGDFGLVVFLVNQDADRLAMMALSVSARVGLGCDMALASHWPQPLSSFLA
jgi:hypothetical protein